MTIISTCGHGYLRISIPQLKKAMKQGYKPTGYSFVNKKSALLEEDCDMGEFLKFYFGDNYIEKAKKIQCVSQHDINKNLYSGMPDSLERLEYLLSLYEPKKDFIGKTIVSVYGDKHTIVSFQKNGYIYKKDGTYWCLPFSSVSHIEEVELSSIAA